MTKPVASLTDDEVVAAADAMMPHAQNARLSYLLGRQREEEITTAERDELSGLMQIYQQGQLRKTEALVEAVRRGLHPRGPWPSQSK